MVVTESGAGHTIVTLTPHLSANWLGTKRFLLCQGVAVFVVALICLEAGAWPVMLLAVLEFALVFWFMYRVCFRLSWLYQRIDIGPGQIVIHQGVRHPQREWVLARPAARLHVSKPANEFDLLKLSLQDDHTRLPVGSFLNGVGREQARRALRHAGLLETSDRWWES